MTSFKGFLAVSLFLGSILAVNGSSAQSSFSWSHDGFVAGSMVTIKVNAAPCHPVQVTLKINGHAISATITEVPGHCTLKVPEGTAAAVYTLEIRCPNDFDSETGTVI